MLDHFRSFLVLVTTAWKSSLLDCVNCKDLSPESARKRAKLRAAYKKGKDLNIDKVFIKGKDLVVNSSKYSVNNLPEYLLPN